MKYQTISLKQFFGVKGTIYYVVKATVKFSQSCEDNMLFSHVKISSFCAKAHLVFHWCLYNKFSSYSNFKQYFKVCSGLAFQKKVLLPSSVAQILQSTWLHLQCRNLAVTPYHME